MRILSDTEETFDTIRKIFDIIGKQTVIPFNTTLQEMKIVFAVIEAYSKVEINRDAENFWRCWYAMQYGYVLGIRAERRRKNEKAAQRCNAGRQAVKPSTV